MSKGGGRHISDALRRVLSSIACYCLNGGRSKVIIGFVFIAFRNHLSNFASR